MPKAKSIFWSVDGKDFFNQTFKNQAHFDSFLSRNQAAGVYLAGGTVTDQLVRLTPYAQYKLCRAHDLIMTESTEGSTP